VEHGEKNYRRLLSGCWDLFRGFMGHFAGLRLPFVIGDYLSKKA
jgi:hypothetical protein